MEAGTLAAIPQRLEVARKVAVERVFAELTKLLCGPDPDRGLDLLAGTGLLDLWLPELRPMVGCAQNRHHRWDVWEHTLEVVRRTPADPGLRWAALLHDAGKPAARTLGPDGEAHFYGHEARSLAWPATILDRLKAAHALRQEVRPWSATTAPTRPRTGAMRPAGGSSGTWPRMAWPWRAGGPSAWRTSSAKGWGGEPGSGTTPPSWPGLKPWPPRRRP